MLCLLWIVSGKNKTKIKLRYKKIYSFMYTIRLDLIDEFLKQSNGFQ